MRKVGKLEIYQNFLSVTATTTCLDDQSFPFSHLRDLCICATIIIIQNNKHGNKNTISNNNLRYIYLVVVLHSSTTILVTDYDTSAIDININIAFIINSHVINVLSIVLLIII